MTEEQFPQFEQELRDLLTRYGVLIKNEQTENRLGKEGYMYPRFKTYRLSAMVVGNPEKSVGVKDFSE